MSTPKISCSLLVQLRSLALSGKYYTRPCTASLLQVHRCARIRPFSSTSAPQNWLQPAQRASRKTHKGRPQVNTGGSTRGTTVVWGNWGLRLKSHDQRVAASHFRIAEECIKRRLRNTNFRIYTRVVANVAVYTSGNDQRMGKGKGSFDYWAARVPHGRVIMEIGGDVHEHIVKDAMRLAGNKLPGQWEFIRKDDPPVMGTTRMLPGVTRERLFRPRRTTELHHLHKLPDGTRAGDKSDVPATGTSL